MLGALAFDLVPFCKPGVPAPFLVKAALIIVVILVVALALAIGTTTRVMRWYTIPNPRRSDFDAFSAKLVRFGSGFGQKQDIFRDKVDHLTKELRGEVAKLVTTASEQHSKLRDRARLGFSEITRS